VEVRGVQESPVLVCANASPLKTAPGFATATNARVPEPGQPEIVPSSLENMNRETPPGTAKPAPRLLNTTPVGEPGTKTVSPNLTGVAPDTLSCALCWSHVAGNKLRGTKAAD
jgi:hypothetical protein